MQEVFIGVIADVYEVGSPDNFNEYQVEYLINILTDDYQVPIKHCVKMDEFGSPDDYHDVKYDIGQQVICLMPGGDPNYMTIVGALRRYIKPMSAKDGRYIRKRFNKVEEEIDNDGNFHLRNDDGPNLNLNRETIIFDDSEGQKITFNKTKKTLTVESNTLNIKVIGNATIQVDGQTKVTTSSLDAKVSGEAKIEAGKLNANINGTTTIKSKGKVKVEANDVEIAGRNGDVLTTETQPVCYVSGIPFQGSKKVKAGT